MVKQKIIDEIKRFKFLDYVEFVDNPMAHLTEFNGNALLAFYSGDMSIEKSRIHTEGILAVSFSYLLILDGTFNTEAVVMRIACDTCFDIGQISINTAELSKKYLGDSDKRDVKFLEFKLKAKTPLFCNCIPKLCEGC